jgi:hypothetical protein
VLGACRRRGRRLCSRDIPCGNDIDILSFSFIYVIIVGTITPAGDPGVRASHGVRCVVCLVQRRPVFLWRRQRRPQRCWRGGAAKVCCTKPKKKKKKKKTKTKTKKNTDSANAPTHPPSPSALRLHCISQLRGPIAAPVWPPGSLLSEFLEVAAQHVAATAPMRSISSSDGANATATATANATATATAGAPVGPARTPAMVAAAMVAAASSAHQSAAESAEPLTAAAAIAALRAAGLGAELETGAAYGSWMLQYGPCV